MSHARRGARGVVVERDAALAQEALAHRQMSGRKLRLRGGAAKVVAVGFHARRQPDVHAERLAGQLAGLGGHRDALLRVLVGAGQHADAAGFRDRGDQLGVGNVGCHRGEHDGQLDAQQVAQRRAEAGCGHAGSPVASVAAAAAFSGAGTARGSC